MGKAFLFGDYMLAEFSIFILLCYSLYCVYFLVSICKEFGLDEIVLVKPLNEDLDLFYIIFVCFFISIFLLFAQWLIHWFFLFLLFFLLKRFYKFLRG